MTEEKDSGALDSKPGNREGFTAILDSVTHTIASSAQVTGLTGGPLLDAVSDAVAVAAREAIVKGGDLVPACKAIVMGVIRGTGATNGSALQILALTAKIVVHHTADRNGNLTAAIKGIILGAIASARMMGVETAKAASTAAQGALEAASKAGSVTTERVLGALKEPIGGSTIVLPEPPAM